MTRIIVCAIASVALFTSCYGTVGVEGGYYDDGYPSAAYIATATPVYYQGYPSYYYGNRWYYRYNNGWRSWHDEPAYLHDYRVHASVPVVRQSYGNTYYTQPTYHGSAPVYHPTAPGPVYHAPAPSYHPSAPAPSYHPSSGGRRR
jgi:hypothetical protein